ncbi:MAG: hypothetical protein JWM90_1962 [Thermoleophilia bacterium]|nr:hypothetical protein [Thermoleophilia bacterium]
MDRAPHSPSPAADLHLVDVSRRFGDVTALDRASLEVRPGELMSIVGPSGCGKSTLLQVIAGHLAPDHGHVTIAGTIVADASTALLMPAQQREVGMVFQDYALFPHLSVLENVAFGITDVGPRSRSMMAVAQRRRRRSRHGLAREVLADIGIEELADRLPTELSGGQQQRVAIARAIAQRPRVLLLDEPFCNLDASTREHVRGEIVDLLRRTELTCVFVTHDQEEALAMSDRVAVMQEGRVLQVAAPEELYHRPASLAVAQFLGRTNILTGTARDGFVETAVGRFALAASRDVSGIVEVLVRPELLDVRAHDDGDVIVEAMEFRGHDVLYTLRLPDGDIVWAHRPSVLTAGIGQRVLITPQAGAASLVSIQSPAPVVADAGRITSSHSGTALTATRTRAGSAASL